MLPDRAEGGVLPIMVSLGDSADQSVAKPSEPFSIYCAALRVCWHQAAQLPTVLIARYAKDIKTQESATSAPGLDVDTAGSKD
jgi:hypothetical protein